MKHKREAIVILLLIAAWPTLGACESTLRGSLARSSVYPFSVEATGEGAAKRATIVSLDPRSSAARRGLRDGDILIAVNGRNYSGIAEARRLLLRAAPGSEVSLSIERAGKPRTLRILSAAAPLQDLPGVDSTYDVTDMPDGARLRTIITRPQGAVGPLPAIYFVQWVSCDSIERPLNLNDEGWQRMLELVIGIPGVTVMRVDKSGVGDSEGPPCWELDYETELAHHREALRRFRAMPGVDSGRLVIYGASMGGNMASLLAAEAQPAGLIIWGTAIKTWFEHLVEFNRRDLELGGRRAEEIGPLISEQIRIFTEYLVMGRTPPEIAVHQPQLASAVGQIRGLSERSHYGRPFRYHQQAHRQNWVGAVAKVQAPILAIYGEYDWFETLDDHILIARIAERNRRGGGTLVVIPRMNHHFSVFPSLQDAYDLRGGTVASNLVAVEIQTWLRRTGKLLPESTLP